MLFPPKRARGKAHVHSYCMCLKRKERTKTIGEKRKKGLSQLQRWQMN
jgi:hypothetical protein